MGKLIEFPKSQYVDNNVRRLKDVSDALDRVIVDALKENVDTNELLGVLAHRLGSLMRNVEDKTDIWDVCERMLKKQAEIS